MHAHTTKLLCESCDQGIDRSEGLARALLHQTLWIESEECDSGVYASVLHAVRPSQGLKLDSSGLGPAERSDAWDCRPRFSLFLCWPRASFPESRKGRTFRTCRTMFQIFLGMFRKCGQDQHAQAQHWLRQAQLMHAQHWHRTQLRTRQGGQPPPLP